MRRLLVLIVSMLVSTAAIAADSNRIIKLEQDMRNLERQVSALQREVRELRQGTRTASRPAMAASPTDTPAPSEAWLSIRNWTGLRVGASELEVIEALGPPTSMRVEDGTRVLLYAMEIGSSGFLSGSVTLKDREVTEISTPVLK